MSTLRSSLMFVTSTILTLLLAHSLVMWADMAGTFSHHMLHHIVLMNIAAPLLAAFIHWRRPGEFKFVGIRTLVIAASAQLVFLFAWHSPPAMYQVMNSPAMALAMQLTLFGSALCFWFAVYRQAARHIWRALVALLLTGKLYCLLAALLVFAPRPLYSPASLPLLAGDLADQQLAGTMMVVACPLSYVLLATILAARWLAALHRENAVTAVAAGEGS